MNSRSSFSAPIFPAAQFAAYGLRHRFRLGVRRRHDDAGDAVVDRLHIVGGDMAGDVARFHLAYPAQAVEGVKALFRLAVGEGLGGGPVFRIFLADDLGHLERLDMPVGFEHMQERSPGHRAVLQGIADEGQPQVELIGEAKQLMGVLMPEHRRLVADDRAAAGDGFALHVLIDQKPGHRVGLEPIALEDFGGLSKELFQNNFSILV